MSVVAMPLASLAGRPPAAPGTTYDDLVIASAPAGWWRLNNADLTDQIAANNGTWPSPPRFGLPPITISEEAASAGFKDAYGVIQDLTLSATFTIDMALQLDRVPAVKHMVLTTGGGVTAGEVSLEIIPDGAGGARVRFWSVPAVGSAVIWRTPVDSVPIAEAFKLSVVRDAATGGVGIYIDGFLQTLTLESGAPPSSWTATPSRSWRIGQWPGSSTVPLEGLMADLLVWSRVVEAPDLQALVLTQGVVWLDDLSAGGALVSTATPIDMAPHMHPIAGATLAVVQQGALGTVGISGTVATYTAGSSPGGDSFTLRSTVATLASRTATVGLTVTAAAGLEGIRNLGQWMGSFGWGTTAGNTGGVGRVYSFVAYRWRADRSGTLDKLRWDINWHRSGYFGGTGGNMRVTLRSDSNGAPNQSSGGILWQSALFVGMANPPAGIERIEAGKIAIPINLAVTKGTVYHIVWTNEHADVTNNWFSINNIHNHSLPLPYHPYGPWQSIATLATNPRNRWIPHFLLRYADGIYVGQPLTDGGSTSVIATVSNPTAGTTRDGVFVEYWGMQREIMGNWQIRQRWTQDDTMTVTRARLRALRRTDSTANDLRIRVEREESGGGVTTLANVTVPASSITRANFDNQEGVIFPCVDVSLGGSVVLEAGKTYRMRVSTDASGTSGTRYGMTAPNGGSRTTLNFGWGAWLGRGEYSINGGSSWVGMHGYGANDKGTHDWNMALHSIQP